MEDQDAPDAEAVAAAYELGRVLGRPRFGGRGHLGVVWRLETERGSFAVKRLAEADEDHIAGAETKIALLRARGVSTPRALRTRMGRYVATVAGACVQVHDWIELADPDPGIDPAAVGTLLGQLHRSPIPASGPVAAWFTAPVPERQWVDLAHALARARAPFAREFAESVPMFVDLQRCFSDPEPLQWCHRDLWADNVRRTPAGTLAVIDWGNAGPASAVQELCCALAEFALGDGERARLVAEAYVEAGGPSLPASAGDFTMALAQFGHFAARAAQEWLAAGPGSDGEDARERAQAWFREGYDRPLDRAGIEVLLSALGDLGPANRDRRRGQG